MPETTAGPRTKKDERTLLTALLLSAPGPAIISYAAFASGSAAQLADFLRRTAELAASFVSWLAYRKLRKKGGGASDYNARLERLTNDTVAAAMTLSGIALLIVGTAHLISKTPGEKTLLGLVIAFLGLLVNLGFWRKYRAMNRRRPDPVISAQQRLYRGKASVDVCVVTALAAVTAAPGLALTVYLDALGSIAVAVYLLYNGADAYRKTRRNKAPV